MKWIRKDLLGIEELSKEEIELILYTAKSFKDIFIRPIKKVPSLRGKTVVNLFFEPSTRTRTSFELAAKRLSADVINFSASTSSITKGETLLDTAKTIESLASDIIVIRHSCAGVPYILSKNVKSSVINAGDGMHEHPTQALIDLFTINEKFKRIKGINVIIIGDIAHSRVAKSNIFGLTKLGANVTVCAPFTLLPAGIEKLGVKIVHDLNNLSSFDVIYLLRMQIERQKRNLFPSIQEYTRIFGIDEEKMKLTKKNCIIMHPGPINRGIEISSQVADGEKSVILDQVTNGIAVRMAVLYLLGTREI
jgi:aspartate carbamoyltransferase catalytic subunit